MRILDAHHKRGYTMMFMLIFNSIQNQLLVSHINTIQSHTASQYLLLNLLQYRPNPSTIPQPNSQNAYHRTRESIVSI